MGFGNRERHLIIGGTTAVNVTAARISRNHETPLHNQAAETTGVWQNQALVNFPQKGQSRHGSPEENSWLFSCRVSGVHWKESEMPESEGSEDPPDTSRCSASSSKNADRELWD